MQWFKCYADLQHHPKRWRFEELAGTEYGLHYLTAWFSYVCKFAPNGDVSAFTPREIARACEWKGDAATLWGALEGAGFIDKTENGYTAHDWHNENGRFIKENTKRKQPTGNPRETLGLPTLQDRTRQDKTGQKPKTLSASDEAEFEQFWQAYPKTRRVGKIAAQKAWKSKKPPLAECLATLAWQKKDWEWVKDEGKWIPHPSSWLNAGKWMDENPNKKDRVPAAVQAPVCAHSDVTATEERIIINGEPALVVTEVCRCGKRFEPITYTKASLQETLRMAPDLQSAKEMLQRLEA